jgi:Mg-chelatase subunit ChlI
LLREEILATLDRLGPAAFSAAIFGDLQLDEVQRQALLSSICSGHHLLLLGPPGSGKTRLAGSLPSILDDIEVVADCPLHCSPAEADCPWCREKRSRGTALKSAVLRKSERVVRVQGSGGLTAEDLIGDLDPEAALREGIYSPTAFIPGKLPRANQCILVVDFIDRVPENVLNVMLSALQGDAISIGALEERMALDTLIVATGGDDALRSLPLDLLDNFDVIHLGYVGDPEKQKKIVQSHLGAEAEKLAGPLVEQAIEIVNQTRRHEEVERGAGTRGMIRNAELLSQLPQLRYGDGNEMLSAAAAISLPHRLKLAPEVDLPGKRETIADPR